MSAASLPDLLEDHRYKRLTTFRRSGETVSTPLWFRDRPRSQSTSPPIL